MKPPKRITPNETDEEACKLVSLLFPSKEWIYRDLTGRDFGIDKIAERFEEGYAASEYLLLQIKGSAAKKIKHPIKFSLKTSELILAEMFSDPVLLVYNFNNFQGECYYVWLQEYIRVKLNYDTPGWRNQKKNTIYFPDENVLDFSKRKEELLYISKYSRNERAWNQYFMGLSDVIFDLRDSFNEQYILHKNGFEPTRDICDILCEIKGKLEYALNMMIPFNIDSYSSTLQSTITSINSFTSDSSGFDLTNLDNLHYDINDLGEHLKRMALQFDSAYKRKEYLNGKHYF